MMQVAGTGRGLGRGIQGMAHAAPPVDEADPQAKSLGYRKDTGKVDDKQYPKHAADAEMQRLASSTRASRATLPAPAASSPARRYRPTAGAVPG